MAPSPKLQFLAETVLAEASHLQTTDHRLFVIPMTAERAAGLRLDVDLSERTDAFVARFGRLQDTLADKLLPELLHWLIQRRPWQRECWVMLIGRPARAERCRPLSWPP